MKLLEVSELMACCKCGRGFGERYERFLLIRHRGLRVRVYGPGTVAVDCGLCQNVNMVKISGSRG